MNFIVPELMGILARGLRPAGTIGVLLIALLATTSCNTTKYLAEDEELLTSYRIKLADPKNIDNRPDVAYELSTLTRQKPNENFLFFWPREYFYFDNSKPRDTTRMDRFLRNTIGQQPAIYSDSLSRLSTAEMTDYLRYLGYFNARSYHEADRGKRKKVNLIYHVEAGHRYIIDSVQFTSPEPTLDSLLQIARATSELKTGEPLDLNKFDQEKARISRLVRNEGFAFFSGAYFDKLEIDTSRRSGFADVFLSILPSQEENSYERYRVGKVTVLTDFTPLAANDGYQLDTVIDGVRFLSNEPYFRMRPQLLRKNIFLRQGELHSREDLEKTNLSLNGLGVYRFVRINQQVDSTAENVLDYQIQLTPGNRMSTGVDLDFNYTNRNSGFGAGNLLGVGLSPSFQNRNVFGGGELLVINLRAGVEVDPLAGIRSDTFFRTTDLAANLSLYLPRFKDFGLYHLLNKVPSPFGGKVVSDNFLSQLRERASTRYSFGYEALNIQQFFAQTLISARLGYDFKRSQATNYRINNLAIDIYNPIIEPGFADVLEQNERQQRSLVEQYFVSLFFRSIEYTRNGTTDRRGRSLSFNGSFEVAGAEVSLLNDLVNVFSEDRVVLAPRADATYAKYTLATADVRYLKNYTTTTSFAARFFVGMARDFGGKNEAVPYVKQFFSGGANSMRAWQPRALGPGGYVDPLSLRGGTTNNLRLFQTGDLRLELNMEYRFPIASFFKGALFADLGNVWTLDSVPDLPGSQFLLNKRATPDGSFVHQPFYRQLALGVGTGLRVDLSYFLFRLDVSLPMRYNYPQEGQGEPIPRDGSPFSERDYWRRFDSFGFGDLTFQLGLGYPF